jgi:predicted RNase H-like HicB family nuclease
MSRAYIIILEPSGDGDDVWIAEIPAFGIVTEGDSRDGARKAALDAIAGYVEVAKRLGRSIPTGDVVA